MKKLLHLGLVLIFSLMTFSSIAQVLPGTLTENFDNNNLPAGWEQQNTGSGISERWGVQGSSNAGGSVNELVCHYQSVNPGVTRIITPAINTIGLANLSLSFKHFFDDYGFGVTIRVQTSTDKINWTNDAWVLTSGLGNYGPETVNTTVTTNLNSTTTYIALSLNGDLYQFDNWYIDNFSIISALTPPSISISKPATGAFWSSGSIQNINWASINVSQTVNLEYSTNGGSTWTTIVTGIVPVNGANSYSWTVPVIVGTETNSMIRVISSDALLISNSNVFTLSSTPQFSFQAPAPATQWVAGLTYEVSFLNNGPYSYIDGNLNISFDGGLTWGSWAYVQESFPGINTINVQASPFWPASLNCKVAFFPNNVNSSYYFESGIFEFIAAPQSVTMNIPAGGSFWQSGSVQTIEWSSVNLTQNINIDYSINGGSTWLNIVSDYGATHGNYGYSWTVPTVVGINNNSLIRVTSGSLTSVSSLFTISNTPQFTITQPTAGSTLTAGQNVQFEINNIGPAMSAGFQFYLSTGNGANLFYLFTTYDIPSGLSQYSWTLDPFTTASQANFQLYNGYTAQWLSIGESFVIAPSPPTITINQPAGGVFWKSGTTQLIEWTSINVSQNVNIQYTLDGTIWNDIFLNYSPSNGYNAYSWTVDAVGGYFGSSQIRVITTNGTVSGISNLFAISETSQILFTQPALSAQVTAGQTVMIELNNMGGEIFSTEFWVYLSVDGGNYWDYTLFTIPNSIPSGISQYTWVIDQTFVTSQAKLLVFNPYTSEFVSMSQLFEILPLPGTMSVATPSAGAFLQSTKQTYIEWYSTSVTQNVAIEYSTDGGTTWTSSVTGIYPNEGYNYYWWTIPTVTGVNPNSLIRIMSIDGTINGVSGVITLSANPQFEFVQPIAGSEWVTGITYPIQINNMGPYVNIGGYIQLSTDNGVSWSYVIYVPELYPGINDLNYYVPIANSANCYFSIVPGWGHDINWQYYSQSEMFIIKDLVPVSQVTISPAGGATSIDTEAGTLQINASVLPLNASFQSVAWTVTDGTGRANISSSGLLTALVNGTVIVTATSTDGTLIATNQVITISNQIVSPEDKNIIKDGGFATEGPLVPGGYWETWSGNGGTANIIGGVCTMVPAVIGQTWEMQVSQSNWTGISNGISYILTFTAWSDVDRTMDVSIEDPANGWVRLGNSSDPESSLGRSDWQVSLTPTPTTYTLHFTVDSWASNSSNKLVFMTSAQLGTVYLDDVSIINEAFGPSSITINQPVGNSLWQSATVQNIEWTSVNVYQNVSLDYSTDGGVSWINIASGISPNNGNNIYNWTVADVFGLQNNSIIRVISADNLVSGASQAFSLLGGTTFAGGDGTAANPYLVANADQLNNVRLFLGAGNANIHFMQTADIDLNVSPWNEFEGWDPIGNTANPFYGKYDGNGFVISGLYINRPTASYLGLFGLVIDAQLNRIGLTNVDITGYMRIGALAGRTLGTSISNCFSSGIIKGELVIGGLVANLYNNSVLEYSYSSVNLQLIPGVNNQQAGGLVARINASLITNCYATGTVNGLGTGQWAGGLVSIVTLNGTIQNSYATGEVSGGYYVGGLVGSVELGSINSCYSVGKTSYTQSGGGLFGNVEPGVPVDNSYWNIETSGQANSPAGEPKNTNQMLYSANFTGWDFANSWSVIEATTYPFLQLQGSAMAINYPPATLPPSNLAGSANNGSISLTWSAPSVVIPVTYNIYRDGSLYATVPSASTNYVDNSVTNYVTYTYNISALYTPDESVLSNSVSLFPLTGFSGGDGSVLNPYLISNAGELYSVRIDKNAHYRQIADIDLGLDPWNTAEGWMPIGAFGTPFKGSYDGDGFIISNLTINRPSEQGIGLFGSIDNAKINNVTLVNANVIANQYVGALAGDVNYSYLGNINVNGTITATNYVGGIVGDNYISVINKSQTSGIINSTGNWAGGIAGANWYNGTINNSFSSMNISASGYSVGGIAGTNEAESVISNSYFLGTVSGTDYIAGIAGWCDNSIVNTCYSAGTIVATGIAGGLVGEQLNSEITNSYWNTETSGLGISAGGLGKTTADMTYPYASSAYAGWDFNYIWASDAGFTINNGYPYLLMLNVSIPSVTTHVPDFISATSAFVGANVTSDGGVPVTERGICWSTSGNPTILNPHTQHWSVGTGAFSTTITGLSPVTTYYVRAYATSSVGTAYGEEWSFTTTSLDPSTMVFSLIGNAFYMGDGVTIPLWDYDLDLNYIGTTGNVSSYRLNSLELLTNGEFKVRKDHQWNESYGYNEVTILGDPGNFELSYVNIKVITGKTYEITFDVDWVNSTYTISLVPLTPSINTTGILAITSNSASVNGELVAEGIQPVISTGVVWNTTPSPTVANNYSIDGSGIGSYVSNLAGLTPNTVYYVRAFAKTIFGGHYYGNELSFVTLNSDASIVSTVYTVDQGTQIISNVPLTETLTNFKERLTPAAGATFEVYEADGTTVALDLQTGYLVTGTAQDGISVLTYSVELNVSMSSEADILSFKIAGVNTVPNPIDSTVNITLPFGTDVINLVAQFTLSPGASADVNAGNQVSGISINDFSLPVVYNITAEDGTIENWTVTVSLTAPSSVANLSSVTYTVNDLAETIVNISGTVTLAVFKSNLIASNGATFEVYQSDGITVATNLLTGYKVIVTAQDGVTTKTYTVTLNAVGSNLANLQSLKVATKNFTILNVTRTASVTLPYGTNLTNLVANFIISDGASARVGGILQVSGVTPNDFTNPVVYEITAENGITVVNWTVTVLLNLPSADATITSANYIIENPSGFIVNVPDAENLTVFKSNLTPAAGATLEVYLPDGITTASDVQKGYKVIVTAQDGITTKTYTIVSSEAKIITYSIPGFTATVNPVAKTVNATVPYGTDVTGLVSSFSISTGATARIAGTTQLSGTSSNDFTSSVVYNVTAEDGTTTVNWTVTISITPASTASTITSIVYIVNNTTKTITNIPLSANLAEFKSKLTPAANATFDVYKNDGIDLAVILETGNKVIVTAQDGVTTTSYTVTLNSVLNNEAEFITFNAASITSNVNSSAKTVTATLPFGTDVTNIAATFSISIAASAKVGGTTQLSGVSTNNFTNPVVYDITAEDGTIVSWTVTLSVITPSSVATVSSTTYTVDNGAETITSVPLTETLATFRSNITPASSATFEIYQGDGSTVATDLQTGYKLIVTAQDGITSKTYTIEVTAAGIAGSNTTICSGNSASLTLTGFSGTIQWQQSDDGLTGWVNVLGGTGETTGSYTTANLTLTTYYRAVVSNPAPVNSNVVTVTVPQIPANAGTISGTENVCQGASSVNYTVPEIVNATSYVWSLPAGATGTSTTNSINVNYGVTFVSGGIEVFGKNTCYDGNASILFVAITPAPASAGIISGTTAICQGVDSMTYSVPAITNATSYIWTLPSGATGSSTTNSIIVDFSSTAASGNITVKGSNVCSNGSASNLPIIVSQLPANAGSISGLTAVCQGANLINYAVPSISKATSYIWTLPEGASGTSTTNIIAVSYSSTAVSGSILWKGHNACGDGGEGSLPITLNALPGNAGKITGSDTICKDQDQVVYRVPSITNATSYVWTLPTGVIGTSTADTIVVNFSASFVAGSLQVLGQNDCGTGTSSSIAVTVKAAPADAGDISGPAVVCMGESGLTYSLPAIDNATSYVWTLPTGASGTSATNSIDVDYSDLAEAGVIEVFGANNCYNGNSNIMVISVNAVPLAAGTITGPSAVCPGTTSVIYAVPTIGNATSYIWTLPTGVTGTSSTKFITVNYGPDAVSGAISVRGHNSCDGAASTKDLLIYAPFQNEQICLVTIDRETGKNMIVWEKTQSQRIASYNIYRQGNIVNQYDSIGNVPFDGLTVFVDETSVPEERQYKYKISAIDSCNNESSMSPWHKTMFLQYVSGSNGVMLSWQPYESEAGSMNFDSYIIMRGADSTALDSLTTISSDLFVYTDKSAEAKSTRMFYRVGGVKHFPCDPAGLLVLGKKASSGPFVHSLSNLEDNRLQKPNGVNSNLSNALSLNVYPSPFTDRTNISYTLEKQSRMKVEVYNVVGEKLKVLLEENQSSGSHKLEMKASDVNYQPGVYYLKIFVDDSVVIRKTMLTR